MVIYAKLMRVDKPIGTLLLLWPTYWALWIASKGVPDADIFIAFTVGTFLMRSAGCVVNDFADRNFDGHVARTRNRPLASGAVSVFEAVLLGVVLLAVSFALVWLLNWQSVLLAVACAAVALFYPLCKRFFLLPQLVLGVAFASPILMAQTAILGRVTLAGFLLFLASVFWALVYDTYYALVDRDDDVKIGLYSSAITARGREHRFLAAMAAAVLAFLLLAGLAAGLNGWYFLGLVIAALLFLYELWDTRHLERERCFRAFVHNNWVGAAVLLGLVLAFLP